MVSLGRLPLSQRIDRRARLLLAITLLSGGLHFVRLSEPRAVVFDEVHFGGFVNAYVGSGAYFFDVHPPHAKLLVAGVAALGGYDGEQEFGLINRRITEVSPALLRAVPAAAGTLIPVLACVLLLQLGAHPWGAFAGGLALALDNALLLQTRILALDGVMIAATLGALCAALAMLEASGFRRLLWTVLCGALVGLAVGTKWTGLAAAGLVALCGAAAWLRDRSARGLGRLSLDGAVVLASAALVYGLGWGIHFALLDAPGPGDVWGAPSGAVWADTLEIHGRMWRANVDLGAGHPYASPWWSWPWLLRGVSYWSGGGSHLILIGNPVVWWGAALGLALVLVSPALLAGSDLALRDGQRAWPPRLWVPLAGWIVCYAPLVGVTRVLFLYHYLSAFVFSVVAVALWLDHVGWTRPGGWRAQRPGVAIALAAMLLGFAALSPFTLSYVQAPDYQQAVYTALPGWR